MYWPRSHCKNLMRSPFGHCAWAIVRMLYIKLPRQQRADAADISTLHLFLLLYTFPNRLHHIPVRPSAAVVHYSFGFCILNTRLGLRSKGLDTQNGQTLCKPTNNVNFCDIFSKLWMLVIGNPGYLSGLDRLLRWLMWVIICTINSNSLVCHMKMAAPMIWVLFFCVLSKLYSSR
jgi:hypothetical protein